jgi:hypothetical protein
MPHDSKLPEHNTLGRIQAIATIFSLVAVPVIVAVLGALIQKSIQSSEARSKSLELAINILKEAPGKSSQPGLREWAIETLQTSSPIAMSELARKELATKPLFPVQPGQRNYGFGGFLPLSLHDPTSDIEDDDPAAPDKKKVLHKFVVQRIDQDSISLLVDGKPTSVYINDSLALAPEGCVLHVLGVGYEPTKEQILALQKEVFRKHGNSYPPSTAAEKEADALFKALKGHNALNSAYTAFVCP